MLDKSILSNLDKIKNACLIIDIECCSHYPDGREINIAADNDNYLKFAKVKWVGAFSYTHNKVYLLNAQKDAQEIMKLLQEHNTLIHFNGESFDFPILVNNGFIDIDSKYLHVDMMQILGTSNFKNKSGYAYKNRGLLMDYKFKNNSLRCIAETMKLDYLKGDIDYKIFTKNQWTPEEEQEIKAYLKNDVMATKCLFEKVWDYWLPFAELLDVKDIYNLSWIRSSIASLTYKAACKVLGTDPTYAEKNSETEEMGGNVYLPKYEELKDVWYVDVGSLYPHMFAMANLPAEVDSENYKKVWHGNDVFQVKGYYNISEWHPLSKYIASKLKERIALKETDKNNPMVYTLKILLNGLYGVMRSSIFEKVHTPNCGWDCCWLGQQVQALIKDMLEQFGFEVVYGDTDSCMFIAKEGTENTKEHVIECLNQIVEVIKDNFPFPVDTFKIGIEHFLYYLMFPFEEQPVEEEVKLEDGTVKIQNKKVNGRLVYERKGKKKNYLFIYTNDKGEKDVKIVGLPIKKDNATALGMKIYDDILKAEIIKQNRAKFSEAFLENIINDYLKKPEILELISQEYKVKSFSSYKNASQIQAQISKAYFNGNEGLIRLIKNTKVGKAGKGTLYCTIEEATEAKLTAEELDLDKVRQELSPFIEYVEPTPEAPTIEDNVKKDEVDVINIETGIEATVSKDEFEACKEVLEPIKRKRGRPRKT